MHFPQLRVILSMNESMVNDLNVNLTRQLKISQKTTQSLVCKARFCASFLHAGMLRITQALNCDLVYRNTCD